MQKFKLGGFGYNLVQFYSGDVDSRVIGYNILILSSYFIIQYGRRSSDARFDNRAAGADSHFIGVSCDKLSILPYYDLNITCLL